MARTRRSGGGFGKVVLGFVLGAIVAGGAGFVYLKQRHQEVPPPVKPAFVRKRLSSPAPKAPLDSEAKQPPFGTSEDVFEAGAHVYKARCAGCHGTPGRDASQAGSLKPSPSQLLKHGRTRQSPGAIYTEVANGAAGTGMPAYRHILSDTAMWQVSLLLANADKPLPDPVMRILTSP